MRTHVQTENAPQPKGPYCQAMICNGMVYVSGQGSIDPKSGEVIHGTIEEETRLTILDVKAVLEAAGSSLENVVRVGVYLADMNDFAAMNTVFAEFFSDVKPVRTTVQAIPPVGLKVEMDCIAEVPE
jgi:2-iminobutanoate/2-iminopropanoate deaminase